MQYKKPLSVVYYFFVNMLSVLQDSNLGLRRYIKKKTLSALLDSNQGPQRYKLCALTN